MLCLGSTPRHNAGIWTEWDGARGTKSNPIEGKHLVYGFLTSEPNNVVTPVHAKAMPDPHHQRGMECVDAGAMG